MSLCDRCKNKCKIDVIESCINFVGEAPHKIVTNFDRITANPEALAEFIKTIIDVCYTCDRCEYPQCTICWCNPIALKNWFNEESKE